MEAADVGLVVARVYVAPMHSSWMVDGIGSTCERVNNADERKSERTETAL